MNTFCVDLWSRLGSCRGFASAPEGTREQQPSPALKECSFLRASIKSLLSRQSKSRACHFLGLHVSLVPRGCHILCTQQVMNGRP